MIKELGDIDGVQYWWCEACSAMAPALKRNKAPDLKHAADCGKLVKPTDAVESAAPMPEQPRSQPGDFVVHALDELKAPSDASEQ